MKNIFSFLFADFLATCLAYTEAFQVGARPHLPLTAKRLTPQKIKEQVDVADDSYDLHDEHELRCPITGYSEGFLCSIEHRTEAIENEETMRQVAIAGSVAASQRNQALGKFCYQTKSAIMEQSELPVELPSSCINKAKLEGRWLLYAVNFSMEDSNAECDVFILSPEGVGEVWRISVIYKAFFNKPYFRITKDGQLAQVKKNNSYDDLFSVLVGWQ